MLDCNIFPGLNRDYLETEVNLFLLPMMENDGEDALTRAGQKIAFDKLHFRTVVLFQGTSSNNQMLEKFIQYCC